MIWNATGPPTGRFWNARVAAWATVGLIGLASIIPGRFEFRTGAPSELEHFVAYALAGGLFGFAYGHKRLVGFAVLLILGACALEVAQIVVPGRTARITDALISGSGALLGLAAGWSIRRYQGRPGARGWPPG